MPRATVHCRSNKTDNHADAIKELEGAGADAEKLGPTLKRLLSKKSKAQYQETPVTEREAREAVDRATKLYEAAQRIVAS